MKKLLFLACILMAILTNTAFCSNLQSQVSLLQYETNKLLDEAKDKEELAALKPVIEANINFFASKVQLKIKEAEVRIEEIKEEIQDYETRALQCHNDDDDDEFSCGDVNGITRALWKKIYKKQESILMYNNLLFVIEQIRHRLMQEKS